MFKSKIAQHFPDFRIRETEILIIRGIHDGKDLEIIQSRENALLRCAQAPCQNGKLKIIICLKRGAEQTADQHYHFIIITVFVCFRQRYIIFVDQYNDSFPIMFMQNFREFSDAAGKCVDIHILFQ